MKIFIQEITDQDTELAFTQEEPWVADAVARTDEKLDDVPPVVAADRPISAEFNVRKVDEVVVLSGNLDTRVRLLCSRCANVFNLPCDIHFTALFCKDPVMAGVGHLQGGQNKGHARHAHDYNNEDLSKDLDITYVSEDAIDLADVIVEQLQLQIPFQPLCKEECKGICAQCGADLNRGRCACAKLTRQTPFSVLENLKIKSQ
jgi:uncharacterized protein